MALNFQNITTLSVQHQPRLFQAGFNYSIVKNLTIEGLLTDLTNSFGVTGIWTGLKNTNSSAIDYQPLIINGVNFGSGRILNIVYNDGVDVRLKQYNATIEILESGNLFNFTGANYGGINLNNFQYLEDFSEVWNFEKKTNGGYSSNHSSNIRFTTGVNNVNAIESAKTLAKTLFTGSNLGFAFYSGYSNKQGKKFFTESYNLINKNCSFGETFDFDSDNGSYSTIRNYRTNIDENGIISATEESKIAGIENPNYQKALAALNSEMTGTFFRCSGVVSAYFPNSDILINSPLTQSRTFDLFANNLSYQIEYSNNPNNSGLYFWDYTIQIERENGIGSITENGNLIGTGRNRSIAFVSAQNGFLAIQAGLSARIDSAFLNSFGSSTNFLTNKSQSFSTFQGRISYNHQYSNDPSLISNNGIRRVEVTKEEKVPIYSYNHLNIINKGEKIQNDKQSTIGTTTINTSIEGDKTVGLQDFLTLATSQTNINAPIGNDRFVQNASYSYNKNENRLQSTVIWQYNLSAAQTIYPQ